MELDYNQPKTECPRYDCKNKDNCKCLSYFEIPAVLGDDSEGSDVAPKNGAYCNAIVKYAANNSVYLYSSEGVPTRVEEDLWPVINEMQDDIDDLETGLADETAAREAADAAIEQEIEDLRNEPDVVDIVGTYAELQAYDTSDLGDKDIIRVLVDEMHDNESTYYRWNKTPQTWTYIGAVEGYYTRGQTDALLDEKQDTLTAGANVQINNNVISATDTTYSAGTGLNLNGTEFSVDLTTIAEKSDIPTTAAEVHALPDTTKYGATLTLTIDSSTYVATATLKDQDGNILGTAQTIDLPLESVVVSGSYDSQTKEVVLTLQNGSTVRFSVADLVSGLQETLIAGTNIQIASDGKTISATDTTYTAGTGLDLTGTQFSIDNTVALKSEIPTDNAQLTNGAGYLTDTDFATSSAAGVVRVGSSYGTATSTSGVLISSTKNYAAYSDAGDYMFIGKGTLENVITGKGLVDQTALAGKQDKLTAGANITIDANNVISATGGGSSGVSDVQVAGTSVVNAGIANIDYASSAAGGVFKTSSAYGQSITSTGQLFAVTKTYSEYSSANNAMFVSKGTLENVIDGKGLVDQTDLAAKQDVLTAGTGISINNNVISATGGEAISAADWTALWADTLPIMNGVGV